jgi:hypothetical protein
VCSSDLKSRRGGKVPRLVLAPSPIQCARLSAKENVFTINALCQ